MYDQKPQRSRASKKKACARASLDARAEVRRFECNVRRGKTVGSFHIKGHRGQEKAQACNGKDIECGRLKHSWQKYRRRLSRKVFRTWLSEGKPCSSTGSPALHATLILHLGLIQTMRQEFSR